MKTPVVSVVMPAYNAEKHIEASIVSVLSQQFTEWELLIINDGSSDNTQEIIDKYVALDIRIKSFYQQNSRQGKARNVGIQQAKGEYVAFLDADDIMFPDRLSYQIQTIEDSAFDMLFNNAYKFKDDYNASNLETFLVKNETFTGNQALHSFLEMNPVPMLTVLVRKKALEEVGCFSINPTFENAEDYHLWLKLLKAGKNIFSTDKIVGAYRLYEQSTTFYDSLSFADSVFAITDILKDKNELKKIRNIFTQKKRIFIADTRKMPREIYFKKIKKILPGQSSTQGHYRMIKAIDLLFGRKASRRYFSILLKILYGY